MIQNTGVHAIEFCDALSHILEYFREYVYV